jgi:predicted O-methyltransferase YrrM
MLRAGMPYDEARKILVDAGWQPFKFPAQTSQEQGCSIRAEICSKYIETEACSGTGLGYCSFLFADATGKYLRVVTIGEDAERLSVERWKIEEPGQGGLEH